MTNNVFELEHLHTTTAEKANLKTMSDLGFEPGTLGTAVQ